MKLALVEGCHREAEPGLSGQCPHCASTMVPKCGERRMWHWAHRGDRHCDHWWEPETEWHRAWKNKFPTEWQEIAHQAENRERHIADVKTSQGRVIEFQHSYLKREERRSREAFYGSMVWVVNGLRRTRDKPSFYEALRARQVIRLTPLTFQVPSDRCALLRDWADSRVDVFFDFGFAQEDHLFGVSLLWHLNPKSGNGWALLSPVPVVNFIEAHLKGVPVKGIHVKVVERRAKLPIRGRGWPPRVRRSESFEQYMARKSRARSRQRM